MTIRFHDLVQASSAPKNADRVERSSDPTHAPDHELRGTRSERFLGTLLNRRRTPHVQASRRTFLRGALTAASAGAAATATLVGPTRSLSAQTSVPVRGQYPRKIISGCDPLHSTHDCRPGCGETPTCNHLGCCDGEGWFRNQPAQGFQPLDTSYCSVVGAPVFADGWLWEYYPDLAGADANGPCAHCKRLVFRCHDGAVYNPSSGVWEPMICRAEVECDPSDIYDRPAGQPVPTVVPTAVPPTPAPVPTPAPLDIAGELEVLLDDSNGQVTVSGWAYPVDGGALEIHVLLDGELWATTAPTQRRRDIEAAQPQAGCCSGFTAVLNGVPAGTHVIEVRGHRGDRDARLATADLTIEESPSPGTTAPLPGTPGIPSPVASASDLKPVGGIDALLQGRLGGAFASGWAGDNDSTLGPFVVASVDGKEVASTRPNLPRPDVAAMFPSFGATSGWSMNIPFAEAGTGQVCISVVDPHDGSQRLLGCRSIAAPATFDEVPISRLTGGDRSDAPTIGPVAPSSIIGALESATSTAAGRVTVRGWACDQADPSRTLRIRLRAGNEEPVSVEPSLDRPDVAAALGASGAHGWVATLPAQPGRNLIEAAAVDRSGAVLAHLGMLEHVVA